MHPIVKELICAVVIALLSQGIDSIRERHMRRQPEHPDQEYWAYPLRRPLRNHLGGGAPF